MSTTCNSNFCKVTNNQIVLDLPKTKIPKANITYQIPWHKSQTNPFLREKNVLDNVMCPDQTI